MNTIENQFRMAIDRSISHTECVSITVEATINEVMTAIDVVTDAEVDYVKNGDIYDIWGWTQTTASDEQDWRLNVTIVELADKEIIASLTDNGCGLLILEDNIAVMDLGNGYEGAVTVGNDDLSQAFDKWLGDTRVEDHASNEIIQFVAFS